MSQLLEVMSQFYSLVSQLNQLFYCKIISGFRVLDFIDQPINCTGAFTLVTNNSQLHKVLQMTGGGCF